MCQAVVSAPGTNRACFIERLPLYAGRGETKSRVVEGMTFMVQARVSEDGRDLRARSLSHFADRGREVPELDDSSIRELFVQSYRPSKSFLESHPPPHSPHVLRELFPERSQKSPLFGDDLEACEVPAESQHQQVASESGAPYGDAEKNERHSEVHGVPADAIQPGGDHRRRLVRRQRIDRGSTSPELRDAERSEQESDQHQGCRGVLLPRKGDANQGSVDVGQCDRDRAHRGESQRRNAELEQIHK